MEYLIRSGALLGFADLVEELGGSPAELLDAAGVPAVALQDTEVYFPFRAFADLLTAASERCGDEAFALEFGSRQGLEVVGALGTWLCLQETVGEAVTRLQRHLGFHARGVAIGIERDRRRVTLEVTLAIVDETPCEQLVGLCLSLLFRTVSQLHGTGLVPSEVPLAIPAPPDPKRWERVFGVTPIFGAAQNRLVYPVELMELPIRIAPEVRDQLDRHWRGNLEQELRAPSLRSQIERAITALLPTGDCRVDGVARLVELHPRVLQGRLRREGTTFGNVLREQRELLAREHLARSDIDLTSLAMNLGYGDLSVFSRAFKEWTGHAPSTWRARAKASRHSS